MKVCFISPLGYGLYRPDGGAVFGGAEVQFFLLSRELSTDPSFQVTVLTTVSEQPGTEQYGRLTLVKRKGSGRLSPGAMRFPAAAFRAWSGYVAAVSEMRNLLRRIDADVYLHAGAGVEVGAYALICRLMRRRFVYVVASSPDLTRPYEKVRGPLRWLYPMGVRMSDAVICRSREQQAWLRKRYGVDGTLIRTGYPFPATSSKAWSPEEKSSVLWVGRMHPLKQPDMFLDLAERLPNERFVMIVMPDSAHDRLFESVRRHAASLANVMVHERLPLDQVHAHFAQAKLFVNTSTYEGFPNTFVQAAMHGVPILSWTVDPDEVLARGGIGFCAGGDSERLKALAAQLCASEALQVEIGRRGEEYARQNHELSRSVEDLKALLRTLAKVPERSGA